MVAIYASLGYNGSMMNLRVVAYGVALALLSTAASAEGQDDPALRQRGSRARLRLRGSNEEIHRLIDEADGRSATFRSLVDTIEGSNAIVMVQFGLCAEGRYRSCVAHIEGNDTSRFIRILVDTRLNDSKVMATIAHELHHATELLADPTVRTPDDVARVMKGLATGSCGKGLSTVCETEGALATEAAVLLELKLKR